MDQSRGERAIQEEIDIDESKYRARWMFNVGSKVWVNLTVANLYRLH